MVAVGVALTTTTVAPVAAQAPPPAADGTEVPCGSSLGPDLSAAADDFNVELLAEQMIADMIERQSALPWWYPSPDEVAVRDDDDGDLSGGALAVLLLAVGGAVAGVLFESFHNNDLNFGGDITVVVPTGRTTTTTATTAVPTTTSSSTTTSTSTTTTTEPARVEPDPTTSTSSTTSSTSTSSTTTSSTTSSTTSTIEITTPTYEYAAAGATKAIDVGTSTALPAVRFEPGEEVLVTLGSTTLARARANELGLVMVVLCVPGTMPAGEHVLSAKGLTSGAGISLPLTVAAQAEDETAAPELPATGSSSAPLVALALALVATGLALGASSARLRRR